MYIGYNRKLYIIKIIYISSFISTKRKKINVIYFPPIHSKQFWKEYTCGRNKYCYSSSLLPSPPTLHSQTKLRLRKKLKKLNMEVYYIRCITQYGSKFRFLLLFFIRKIFRGIHQETKKLIKHILHQEKLD